MPQAAQQASLPARRRAVSDARLQAARDERDAERAKAKRAREAERDAKKAAKQAKKEKNAERRELAKQYGKLALVFGFAVATGATIGGQLTRINKPWIGYVQGGLILVGLGFIAAAKTRRWMMVVGISLVAMGGVKLSDISRTRDFIFGDHEWEKPIPPRGTEGWKIEVVPDNG